MPFMVRYPGVTPKAAKSDALFAAVDIYPTLCGLAGIAVPPHCVGRDHSPIMRGQTMPEAEMVFLMNQIDGDALALLPDAHGVVGAKPEFAPGEMRKAPGAEGNQEFVNYPSYRGVRTKTHTYAVAKSGRWLLFDNVADPYQMKNLVGDPSQKALMETLDAAILEWMKASGDTFPYRESLKKISDFPS